MTEVNVGTVSRATVLTGLEVRVEPRRKEARRRDLTCSHSRRQMPDRRDHGRDQLSHEAPQRVQETPQRCW